MIFKIFLEEHNQNFGRNKEKQVKLFQKFLIEHILIFYAKHIIFIHKSEHMFRISFSLTAFINPRAHRYFFIG